MQVREAVTEVELKVVDLLLQKTHPGLEKLLHVGVPHETVKNEKRVFLVVVDFEWKQCLKVNQLLLLGRLFGPENAGILFRGPIFLQLFLGHKKIVHDR